jgi:hypothetical protein
MPVLGSKLHIPQMVVTRSLVVVILAVTPWRYVCRTYARAGGDRWR